MIRRVRIEDAQQLLDIYNYYVLHTVVTFDDVPLTLNVFIEKIISISKDYPFLVFEENNEILGYAYGSRWRKKPAYDHTVETTIYLRNDATGKKIGTRLYAALFEALKKEKYHTFLGGLTLPNEASIKLHENFGFEKVAHFKEVGFKFNKWLDVGFWQKIIG